MWSRVGFSSRICWWYRAMPREPTVPTFKKKCQLSWHLIQSKSYLMFFVEIFSSFSFSTCWNPFEYRKQWPGHFLTQRFSTDVVDSLGKHVAFKKCQQKGCVAKSRLLQLKGIRPESISNGEKLNSITSTQVYQGSFSTHIPAASGMESELSPWSNE